MAQSKQQPPSGDMTIKMFDIEALTPDPNNPRVNTGAISQVAESIRLFGFRVPLVVDADGNIIAGHTRYRAAISLGMTQVPCVLADDLTQEQRDAFAVAENRTSDFAFFDVEKLGKFVEGIDPALLAAFDIDAVLLGGGGSDDDDDMLKVKDPEKRNGLDLAPFERYQYVMVLCRTEHDYLNLLDQLGLEDKQKAYVEGTLKRGSSYGRVIEYPEFVDRISQART
jgi:hypothetical protein